MKNLNILYHGRNKQIKAPIKLKAGNLDLNYENGFLRYIRTGKIEVLRMIYFAVRDQNWNTIEGKIRNEKINKNSNSFEISYISDHKKSEVDITFKCRIIGSESGYISFSIDGISNSSFLKNRIGFCILHPVKECVGKDCIIEHWDGKTSTDTFPELISPHQPFFDIRSMKWNPGRGLEAVINFEGEVFEMEDQRNWTDASYKTYCTPLGIPFPVRIEKGDEIRQKVELGVENPADNPEDSADADKSHILSIGGITGSILPALGTAESSFYDLPGKQDIDLIRKLALDHLRVEINLGEGNITSRADKILELSRQFDLPLMLVLFVAKDPEKEYTVFADYFKEKIKNLADSDFPGLKYIIAFDKSLKTTSSETLKRLHKRISTDFPDSLFGAGTNVYFTELNRDRVDPSIPDFLTWSINPQVHAFDLASLTETLEAQSYTVNSARAMAAGKDLVVSPVTLKPRFNPNATGPEPEPEPGELPSQVDERQMSLYGAGWTLGSIKYLAESGVTSITYFETSGWRGMWQGNQPSQLKEKFKADAGDIFPLYYVFAWLKEFKGQNLITVRSSDPLIFDGLGFYHQGKIHLLLSNFTGEVVDISPEGVSAPFIHLSLNEENINQFRKNPEMAEKRPSIETNRIVLNPFSVNWIVAGKRP